MSLRFRNELEFELAVKVRFSFTVFWRVLKGDYETPLRFIASVLQRNELFFEFLLWKEINDLFLVLRPIFWFQRYPRPSSFSVLLWGRKSPRISRTSLFLCRTSIFYFILVFFSWRLNLSLSFAFLNLFWIILYFRFTRVLFGVCNGLSGVIGYWS